MYLLLKFTCYERKILSQEFCLNKKYKSIASVNEKLACFFTDICNILNATKTDLEKGNNMKRKERDWISSDVLSGICINT